MSTNASRSNGGAHQEAVAPASGAWAAFSQPAVGVPRDSELIRLHDLAALLAARADLSANDAERRLLAALLGGTHRVVPGDVASEVDFAGLALARLAVYRCFTTGPQLLGCDAQEVDGQVFQSARARALQHVGLRLVMGEALKDIAAGYCDDEPAPRYLAVVLAEALAAFGLPSAVREGQTSGADVGGVTADSRIVQPAGGSWKHAKGTKWSEAEKTAMQAMRKAGMTDAEIAKVAGCKRQVVGQQIKTKAAARVEVALQRQVAQLTV